MSRARGTNTGRWRPEYTVALIGLSGVILTNVVTNWDRLGRQTVTLAVEDYAESEDYDTELRLYLDRSGERRSYDDVISSVTDTVSSSLGQDVSPEEARHIASVAIKNLPTFDEYLAKVAPIYRKYLSLSDLQRLNRILSTPELRGRVRRDLAIGRETNKVFAQMVFEGQRQAVTELAASRREKAGNKEN